MRRQSRADHDTGVLKRQKALRHFFTTDAEKDIQRYGANAIGFGPKVRGQQRTGSLAVRVYVPPGNKPKRDPNFDDVARSIKVVDPDSGDGFEFQTDVDTARRVRLQSKKVASTTDGRVPGGEACGGDPRFNGSPGTLGGWVWDRENAHIVLLSAEHVLGQAAQGSRRPVFMPPLGTKRTVGSVVRSVGLGGPDVSVDCAIGTLDSEKFLLQVVKIGPAVMSVAQPEMDMEVEKFGMNTKHTRGQIDNPFWTGFLEFEIPNAAPVLVRGCMRVVAARGKWSDAGDSGSLIFQRVARDGSRIKSVVGLHFAGDPGDPGDTSIGIACPIDAVFRRLNVDTLSAGLVESLASLALPNRSPVKASELLRELAATVPPAGATKPVADLMGRHEGETVELLLLNDRLRAAGAQALAAVVQASANLDEILHRLLSDKEGAAVRDFARRLEEASRSAALRSTSAALERLAETLAGKTVRQILGVSADSLDPARPAKRDSTRPSQDDIVAFLNDNGRDVQLLSEFGADEVFVDTEKGASVLVLAFRGAKPLKSVPDTMAWERSGEPTLTIPVRARVARPRRPIVKK